MKRDTNLRAEFEFVRCSFFPRWDHQRQWRVRSGQRGPWPSEYGYCDDKKNLIWIARSRAGSERKYLRTILIHEICHAVVDGGHGKKWCRRMKKAVSRAEDLGEQELARLLKEETEAYENEKPVSASEVYGTIEDVMLDLPDLAYKDMIRAVGREYDMYPREFEKKYKRSRSVYEKAKRFAQEIQARIAKRDTPKPSGQRE